ncbi:MAG: glycosyltransferase [Pseudomonadota bacterium]
MSVSAGAGHVRAAQALCANADLHGTTVTHLDVMQTMPDLFRQMYTHTYMRLVGKYPHAWGWLYRHMQQARSTDRTQRLRRWFERRQGRALLSAIQDIRPDAIISTHFLPAELLAYLPPDKKLPCPVWVQVTDYDLHRIWIQPEVAGYFVASDEVAFRLQAEGVARQRIHVVGLPIMPAFAAPTDRIASAASLHLDPAQTTILLMGGGAGLGNIFGITEKLLSIEPPLQLIVLTGSNTTLYDRLATLAAGYVGRLVVQAQVTDVERFMACADLIVTKSGGLTSAECLAMGLPMIINAPIPGQEESNADYLVEQGVALKAADAITVEYRVRCLLNDPVRLKQMSTRARALARPAAATRVMQIVLSQLKNTTFEQ